MRAHFIRGLVEKQFYFLFNDDLFAIYDIETRGKSIDIILRSIALQHHTPKVVNIKCLVGVRNDCFNSTIATELRFIKNFSQFYMLFCASKSSMPPAIVKKKGETA